LPKFDVNIGRSGTRENAEPTNNIASVYSRELMESDDGLRPQIRRSMLRFGWVKHYVGGDEPCRDYRGNIGDQNFRNGADRTRKQQNRPQFHPGGVTKGES
jgi:hypothetical protein